MRGRISERVGLKNLTRFGRRHENCGSTKASPRQSLSATVAECLIFPLHGGLTTGAYGKCAEAVSPAEGANRLNPHGRAIGLFFHVGRYLKEAVGRFSEAVAEVLQNGDGRNGFPADDGAEIL